MRILLLDDDSSLMSAAQAHFRAQGLSMECACDGPVGLQMAVAGTFDCIVLERSFAGIDGLQLCGRLQRALPAHLPIIMLGKQSSVDDMLAAFSAGADDYLTKPFDLRVLEARIRAVHRRTRPSGGMATLRVADLEHNPATCETRRGGRTVRLGRAGRRILELLMRESPKVVTRPRLEFEIWGNKAPKKDLLRSHLSTLRLAVDSGSAPKLIHTVHRVGIRLAPQ